MDADYEVIDGWAVLLSRECAKCGDAGKDESGIAHLSCRIGVSSRP
jgi:hypothetical protein